jgi:hypothetical protein
MLPVPVSPNILEKAFKGINAEMCITFKKIGEGEDAVYETSFSKKDMNYFECLELTQEIALACRLARIAPNVNDPHEEKDLIRLDNEHKLCVTYDPVTQDYHYARKGLSLMDTAIACETVAATCRAILYAPAVMSAWYVSDEIANILQQIATGKIAVKDLDPVQQSVVISAVLHKLGYSGYVSPATEIKNESA